MMIKNKNRDLFTVTDLQLALITEIEKLLKDLINDKEGIRPVSVLEESEDDSGLSTIGFKGYAQSLPQTEDQIDADQLFPYFIVRIDSAETDDDSSLWVVTVHVFIGVFDTNLESSGHFHVLNAIQRIVNRFDEESTIGTARHKTFRCLGGMRWALQDEDTYPYYFGQIEMKFAVPRIERQDPFYG